MMNRPAGSRASRKRFGGFSVAELLIVVGIIGIGVMVAVPLVAEQFRAASARAAADQFATDLRAARMIAVSKRTPVSITVAANPTNTYQYTDAHGRLRRIVMPAGVRITSSSSPITFKLDGSLSGSVAASTVIEANMTGSTVEQWTITTSVLGVPSTVRQRI